MKVWVFRLVFPRTAFVFLFVVAVSSGLMAVRTLAQRGNPAPPATTGEDKKNDAPAPRTTLTPSISPATPNASAPTASSGNVPIAFQSHGLDYEALTRDGITVMFAALPPQLKEFNIVQITVTNGSLVPWTTKPTDFSFVRTDGTVLSALTADAVVESLLEKASRNDVIKLQMMYENSIYALANYRPTNGYERRREAAMAQFVNSRFSAAAAASAVALAPVKLKPGDSTDGAVFFEAHGKEHSLGAGLLVAQTCGEKFSFTVAAEAKVR